jgi:hypothetical protein
MLDTYNDYNPNNPINQDENAEELKITPFTLYESVNECNDIFIDIYFTEIEDRLEKLISFSGSGTNKWLQNELTLIKDLLK